MTPLATALAPSPLDHDHHMDYSPQSPTSSPILTLPLEITDHILDCVASQRVKKVRATLASCSLVCRGWVYQSRFNFFRDCRLLVHLNNALAFAALLRSPYCTILPHVRRLTMVMNSLRVFAQGDTFRGFDDINDDLRLLAAVESLKLSGSCWAAHGAPPRRGFMSSLAGVVDLEIDCPDMGDLDHASLIICAFPALRRLTVHQFSIPENLQLPTYTPPTWIRPNEDHLRPPPLSSLCITCPALMPVLAWLNWAGSSCVTRLELSFSSLSLGKTLPLRNYLRGLSHSLEYLTIRSPSLVESRYIHQNFDLRDFTHLRAVHFEQLHQRELGCLKFSLLPILQSLTSPELETLAFVFEEPKLHNDPQSWRLLDQFFCQSQLPGLKTVQFSGPAVQQGVDGALRTWLSRTDAMGILDIQISRVPSTVPAEDLQVVADESLAFISEFLIPL
ncbi:hypothetical protein C8F04DRAFT_1127484 [Mycena alexandri]|uniref:F-box domain-containing protein n=1 Tax=Mycena alexandri TaxID=1745969 RepID=A0AAD6SEW7_9AGAR|nr:hypothetical protein C8F04DRAFT_1127484 [Mycena alexandri]